ncbi:MAG: PHP domain-containing protein [Patescibacteria group bacterium]|nr:PHP domain-containing protein [Patescibacteria group bacterium]
MLIDLQLHSTYSDGYLTPTAVARFLKKNKVRAAALTDHNTVSGLSEFFKACKQLKIKTITGIELYVRDSSSRFNILWYNFDSVRPELHDLLRNSQVRRRRSIRSILNKLVDAGFEMNVNATLDKYNHYVPVNQMVSELIGDKNNFKKIQKELKTNNPREEKIIKYYFRNKKFGILRETYINFDKIIKLRKIIGGQLILCHPAKYGNLRKDKIIRLKKAGLDGVEVLSPHHSYGAIVYIQHLAHKFDLIETGGSDFHRYEGHDMPIQSSSNYFQIESKYLKDVKKIIG